MFEIYVGTTSQVCNLLQEDSVGPEDFAYVNHNFLASDMSARKLMKLSEIVLTIFCAENIEFMIGMYDAERSGETDKMRMRGSGKLSGSSGLAPDLS